MAETTTVRIRQETKNLLDKLVQSKSDTYDDIILRLTLKALGQQKKQEKT